LGERWAGKEKYALCTTSERARSRKALRYGVVEGPNTYGISAAWIAREVNYYLVEWT
jgi:hypothetical protein